MSKFNYKIYLPIAFSLVLIAGIIIGSRISGTNEKVAKLLPIGHPKLNKVESVLEYIERDYVDTVDLEKLQKDAISAMLKELDPHSSYITASDFHEINDPLLGSFEGIGISFRIEKDSVTVINTIPGGPSEKVGLMAGDRIVKVDDTLFVGKDLTNNKAIRKLKGPKGTKVEIAIFRRDVPELLYFTIIRDVIPTYSLDIAYMVDDKTGYIKLNKFSATTFKEFKTSLDDLLKQGMSQLILDLRGNPGGYLNAAINIADEFLDEGELIVYTEGKNRPRNYAFADGDGDFKTQKLIVLVDEGSASASEIVSGAIQDNDRGTIIGRRSFGKGLVQEQLSFPDNSALRLTVAKYYTPTGRCIQKPYNDGFEDYFTESYHRYLSGEMESADSIHFNDSLKFVTKGGKVVYGGGGIMPDVYVPLESDSLNVLYNMLANKGLIFRYAFDYTDKNRTNLNKYTDFKSFDAGFNMSKSEYGELLEYAKTKGIKFTKENADYSKDKISILFKSYVGRNILNEKGFYPIYHKIDKVFLKAVEEINK